ncbi:MAG: endopolygalacturonase, partial [Clostridiales bacterium]|nr:endopolygalacturonase [Clostridiales bacterium]
ILTVPAGIYPTGSIRLYSHMTLEVQAGATLLFIQDEKAYPPQMLEFEGIPGEIFRPCVFAQNAENVKITGDGTLDGQGEYWWKRHKAKELSRPRPYLVCFADCRHVTIENVNLINSPCWTVHPLRCEDVIIRGLRISNPAVSPNTDGIDPDCCRDVRIHDCTIDVGDDCISIKSGTEDTANRRPSERIIIENCHFLHGHGGVVMGSEMSGDIRNVLVNSCVFYETDRGIRLKTRRGRGGVVEGIQLTNLIMERVMCAFVFNMYYYCGKGGKEKYVWDKAAYPVDERTPRLRDVRISDVSCRGCTSCAGFFWGLSEMPIEGVTMKNVLVEMDSEGADGTPAMMNDCPVMNRRGFFLRNAANVDLSGVRVTGLQGELMDTDESVKLL